MCLGLPAQFDHTFFRRHLSGPLRSLHLRLMWGYFRWVRVVTTAPTLEYVTGIDDCAIDICDCRLARLHILTAGKRWELCHCCSCCCLILDVVNLCGEPFIHPSGSHPVRVTRAAVCNGCEACVEACPLGVRAIEGVIDPDRCIGCGVCTAVCPQGAWEMSAVTSPPTLKPPPKWWSYVFGLFHLGYLNWLVLVYALSDKMAHRA
jgi:NAD-dependent dihydropyrimidine dehydrogenase PreA subunit